MRGLKFRGRPPINFAGSVKDVVNFNDYYSQLIMDRGVSIDGDFIDAIRAQTVLTWEGRNPSPALDPDGNFVGTDLDLMSFLVPLAERGAVIEFPRYTSHRASTVRANERRISTPSRFGPLTGMTSNQKFFSISTRMIDNSVIVKDLATGREKPGAFRNFMVVAPDGKWHPGWEKIVFDPSADENKFLTGKGLWTGNSVYFNYAVHPNRWQSVFGAPYLLLKMLIDRLSDEYSYYDRKGKELKAAGIEFPVSGGPQDYGPSEPSGVEQEKVTVTGFESIIDLPPLTGKYPDVPITQAGLISAYQRAKDIRYTLKPNAQLVVRIDELAYFKHGLGKVAPWMKGRSFKDFTPPRGKINWQQMVLSNDVSYRWRTREVSDTVAVRFAA